MEASSEVVESTLPYPMLLLMQRIFFVCFLGVTLMMSEECEWPCLYSVLLNTVLSYSVLFDRYHFHTQLDFPDLALYNTFVLFMPKFDWYILGLQEKI